MTVKNVHIKNFKSIVDLSLDLGQINVLIGENGSGKSNILEAFAFAGAADAFKLNNEFLTSRGIRVTEPAFMRSAFIGDSEETIAIDVQDESGIRTGFRILNISKSIYPSWSSRRDIEPIENASSAGQKLGRETTFLDRMMANKMSSDEMKLAELLARNPDGALAHLPAEDRQFFARLLIEAKSFFRSEVQKIDLQNFVIYSPENSALRTLEKEGQILPLGIRGEGLLKLLRVLASEEKDGWQVLQHNLGLLDWLAGIDLDQDSAHPEQSIRLRDRFVPDSTPAFDQRSANEGFLYLLFFFALVVSKATPRFFAVENVDTSLNPKACSELMRRLAALAIERQKQILFTTHNPALLDGLNLHDDNQRLFVVSRNRDGHTTARRIPPPRPVGDELPIRLSEAFTRGLLGGIPQNF